VVFYTDDNSEAFRVSLYDVFKRAGWGLPAPLAAGNTIGVAILARQDGPAAIALEKLFEQLGYSVEMRIENKLPPQMVELYIGTKPRHANGKTN
jgi:hypothetical protein